MNDARKRLNQLGTRLDALTERAKTLQAGKSPKMRQSLASLRNQWEVLRGDVEAAERLGGRPGDDMMVPVERALTDLEQAHADVEARLRRRRSG